jgi:hypothetical protein
MQAFFRSPRTPALRCLELLNIPYEPNGVDVSIPTLHALEEVTFGHIDPVRMERFFRSSTLPSLKYMGIPRGNGLEGISLPRLQHFLLATIEPYSRTPWTPVVNIRPLLQGCENLYIYRVVSFNDSVLAAMSSRTEDDCWICPNILSLEIHENFDRQVRITPAAMQQMIKARRNGSAEANPQVAAIQRLVVHSPLTILRADKRWFKQNLNSFVWDDRMPPATQYQPS